MIFSTYHVEEPHKQGEKLPQTSSWVQALRSLLQSLSNVTGAVLNEDFIPKFATWIAAERWHRKWYHWIADRMRSVMISYPSLSGAVDPIYGLSHEARRGNGGGQHWLGLTAGCEFSTENQSRLASVTGMPLINVDSNLTCDQAFFFFRERKNRRTAKGRGIEKRDRRPWDLVFHNW